MAPNLIHSSTLKVIAPSSMPPQRIFSINFQRKRSVSPDRAMANKRRTMLPSPHGPPLLPGLLPRPRRDRARRRGDSRDPVRGGGAGAGNPARGPMGGGDRRVPDGVEGARQAARRRGGSRRRPPPEQRRSSGGKARITVWPTPRPWRAGETRECASVKPNSITDRGFHKDLGICELRLNGVHRILGVKPNSGHVGAVRLG